MLDTEKAREIFYRLDHLAYMLNTPWVEAETLRGRVRDEWILQKPATTYGNPPEALSGNMDKKLFKKIMDGLCLRIEDCLNEARRISDQC